MTSDAQAVVAGVFIRVVDGAPVSFRITLDNGASGWFNLNDTIINPDSESRFAGKTNLERSISLLKAFGVSKFSELESREVMFRLGKDGSVAWITPLEGVLGCNEPDIAIPELKA